MQTEYLAQYISNKGFEAFYNVDGRTVSFYMPIIDNNVIRETLHTVSGYDAADEIMRGGL